MGTILPRPARASSPLRRLGAHKTGRWEGQAWIAEPGRNAEIFIFGWHDRTDASADHREPSQWLFFVIPETDLPAQASLSLATLRRLADPVPHNDLRARVEHVAKRFRSG